MKILVDGLKHGIPSVEVDLDTMPEAWIQGAIANGVRQSVGDADAGKAGDRKALCEAKLARVLNPSFVWGSGGGRSSGIDTYIQAVVREYLKAAGWKHAVAVELAKNPEEGFVEVLKTQCKAKGVVYTQVMFDKNWPGVVAKAKARLAEDQRVKAERAKELADLDIAVDAINNV